LLDGESWRARRTVADRDGLPVDVLKGLMKWPDVQRVWLPEWLQQREQTLDRLAAAVEEVRERLEHQTRELPEMPLAAAPTSPSVPYPSESRTMLRSTPPSSELRHPHVRVYIEWQPRRSGTIDTLDRLPNSVATEKVRSVLREIVQKEGPIHKMRLARLAAEAFGLHRVAAARADAILRCLPLEFQRTTDTSCAWPTDIDPETWRDVRRSQPGDGRNVDHIPLEEIANAMAVVAQLGGGMSEDELKRQALALFGAKRLTEGVASRLDAGLRRGLETGRIERDDRGLIRAV
jgi:hypothetical protein